MYIARRVVDGRLHFRISHSFKEERWWRNRDLVDLGPEPGCLILPAEREDGFKIEERVEKELLGQGIRPGPGELEELFLPFAPEHLRQGGGMGRRGGKSRRRLRLRESERQRLQAEIALFDRRRLHYLVWGDFDLAAISLLPIEAFQSLADKSRDEIEQDFLAREQPLEPEEFNRYVFSVFNLHPYFIYLESGAMAPGREAEGLDLLFIEELCLINGSPWYWMRDDPPRRLHPYLSRYVVMFFDYHLQPGLSWEDYLYERDRPRPVMPAAEPGDEVEELFGISIAEAFVLSEHDLHSLYKKRAQVLHPDHGGDQERFIRLRQTYEELMRKRGMA